MVNGPAIGRGSLIIIYVVREQPEVGGVRCSEKSLVNTETAAACAFRRGSRHLSAPYGSTRRRCAVRTPRIQLLSDRLAYAGEEDLLAYYFSNYDQKSQRHFIVPSKSTGGLNVESGKWSAFIQSGVYKRIQERNAPSYLWDHMLQGVCEDALMGNILSGHDLTRGKSPIHEMSKEPRFYRHSLSEMIHHEIQQFPRGDLRVNSSAVFLPSFFPRRGYVFLQIRRSIECKTDVEHRRWRRKVLQIACMAAKLKCPNFDTIIGIATDPHGFVDDYSEDFLLLGPSVLSEEMLASNKQIVEESGFFRTVVVKHYSPN
jgi:hypothetical protein